MSQAKQIGDALWVAKAFNSAAAAAGTTNGTSMDRMTSEGAQGFESCVLHVSTGTTAGTPTSFSVVYSVEESADDSSWTAVSGATATITAVNTEDRINLNLGPRARYVRCTAVRTFVDGTTPTVVISGVFVFGSPKKIPVASLTT